MNIMQFLMKHWDIAGRTGLSVEAQQAQEDVCKLQARCPCQAPRLATSGCYLGSSGLWLAICHVAAVLCIHQML